MTSETSFSRRTSTRDTRILKKIQCDIVTGIEAVVAMDLQIHTLGNSLEELILRKVP
jgi:hypothetical protein